MALVKCPECGQTVSDKAEKCPKCGYPMVQAEKQVDATPEEVTPKQVAVKRKKKPLIFLVGVVFVVAAVAFFVKGSFGVDVVSNLEMTTWRVTDSYSYGNDYEATIVSEQKKPFLAVIGSYEDEDLFPMFAFMENGKGKFEVYASNDVDPSVKYHPIGYCKTEKIGSSEMTMKYKDRNYYDSSYSEETSCAVDIDLQLNSSRTGLLMVDIENVTNKETECNIGIPIINGVGKYTHYAELPYKSRGIEIKVTPVCFVSSKKLDGTEFAVEKEFSVKMEEGALTSYYTGEGVWNFPDLNDGIILYTMELKEGGEKEKRGDVQYKIAYLHNHEITITSYDGRKDSSIKPQYDINLIGYLSWTELSKGEKI